MGVEKFCSVKAHVMTHSVAKIVEGMIKYREGEKKGLTFDILYGVYTENALKSFTENWRCLNYLRFLVN